MPEEWVDMRDVVGPYAGRIRPYLKHAAENAAASGFAEYVSPREEVEAEIDATEAALALAAEQGLDLGGVQGTGADGRITKADVKRVLAEREAGG